MDIYQYFEAYGRTAFHKGHSFRVILDNRNVIKSILVLDRQKVLSPHDIVTVDTSKYRIKGKLPHRAPEVSKYQIDLIFN